MIISSINFQCLLGQFLSFKLRDHNKSGVLDIYIYTRVTYMYELRTIVLNGRNGNEQFVLTVKVCSKRVQGTTEYCLCSL